MATLKSKRKKQDEVEQLITPTEEETTPPVEETTPESKYLNEAEQKALSAQNEKDTEDSKKVSIDKMEDTVRVVSETFNLSDKGFSVNGFSDKGTKVQLSVSNGDFDLVVTIKDAEKFGIL